MAGCFATAAPGAHDALVGTYTLESLAGQPLPADVWGCCITLGGSLQLTASGYEIRDTQRNRNNQIVTTVQERGTYTVSGSTITFRMTEFVGYPFLLAPGVVDGSTIRVKMGDEGPGSPGQKEAVYRR